MAKHYYAECRLCQQLMLSVTNKLLMPSVIVLNVIMLSVVAPLEIALKHSSLLRRSIKGLLLCLSQNVDCDECEERHLGQMLCNLLRP